MNNQQVYGLMLDVQYIYIYGTKSYQIDPPANPSNRRGCGGRVDVGGVQPMFGGVQPLELEEGWPIMA